MMLLFAKTSKTTTAHGYLLYAHSKKNEPTQNKPTVKTSNTAHCRQSVKQTTQRAERVAEHTVPKNRNGALNAMRSTRREVKDTREVERATRDETETLQTGSRASNARRDGNGQRRSRASSARRNGNGACGKASEKRATQRDGTVGTNRREMKTERTMLADHSKKLNQTT